MPVNMVHQLKGKNIEPKVKLGYLVNLNSYEGHADVNTGHQNIPDQIKNTTEFKETQATNHYIQNNLNVQEEFPNKIGLYVDNFNDNVFSQKTD